MHGVPGRGLPAELRLALGLQAFSPPPRFRNCGIALASLGVLQKQPTPFPMSRAAQTTFLAALHADRSLQQALTQPGVLDLAVRIARAAGYEISSGDLMASPAGQVPWSLEDRPPAEGGEIDFDGDGVPDAVMEGGRWVLLDSED